MTKSLGVIGGGVLGRAVSRGFMEHLEVRVHDQVKQRATHAIEECAIADIVMICLPTPANSDGKCDTGAIDRFLHQAYSEEWWRKDSCYVVRSTVPIGYTQGQASMYLYGRPLLHSPEFLTARCALADFQVPARNIIGVPLHYTGIEDRPLERLRDLYEKRFPGVLIHEMSSNESELVKLACNSFFAAKVTLFNLFAEIAAAHCLSWDSVRAGIMSDGRIAHAHTAVPGPDGKAGWGGACLGKDLADLFHSATAAGVDAGLLRDVLERNARTRAGDDSLAKISLPAPAKLPE